VAAIFRVFSPKSTACTPQRITNGSRFEHHKKHNYLLARRVTCGVCGYKMHSIRTTQGYQYYRCPSGIHQNLSAESCKLPYFRVDKTDAAVWEWVAKLLSDPEKIEEFIIDYNEYKKVESEPVYKRIKVIDKLLGDNRQQLERLLDLYLTGDFPKDILLERQRRLESQIEGLEEEKTRLQASLRPATITQNQLDCLSKIARGLDIAKDNFEAQRRIIEELNLRVTLWVEDGEKKADISLLGNYQNSSLLPAVTVL
ncbi:MAG: zinc ribbon domain-containing protein, partial [Anaerolineae bacterium]|nr:zinc ribbon domain-containing protein [Anaerolineae bacterium]